MSRSKLESIRSQARLSQRVQQHILSSICLIAVVGVALWADDLSRVAAQAGQSSPNTIWEDVAESSIPTQRESEIKPRSYRTLRLDMGALSGLLANAPMEFTREAKEAPVTISLPMPDGKFGRFKVIESPMVEPGLAAKYPQDKTYSGIGVDDPMATTRFDITMRGFHAIILSSQDAVFIAPYSEGNTEHYISFYNRDRTEKPGPCSVTEQADTISRSLAGSPNFQVTIGGTLHNYTIAVAATAEYTNLFRQPTDSDELARSRARSAIQTMINAVNAIYGRDVGIFLTLSSNNDAIIYTDPNTDPYTSGDKNCGTAAMNCSNSSTLDCLQRENQCNLDSVIGTDNYDIGHVFDGPNIGGQANTGVCVANAKARAVSGGNFVIVTAHEIGHQFNAPHTFNNNATGSCGNSGEYSAPTAFEPGSGSTLMSYAGTCDSANLQLAPDLFFHHSSVLNMHNYITTGGAANCDSESTPANRPPTLDPLPGSAIHIPSRTPFALTATAIDPDGDTLNFSWEEADSGGTPSPPEGDDGTSRPILRAYNPVAGGTRLFPSSQYILNNANTPPATYGCGVDGGGNPINCLTGELLPTTTRILDFNVIARDNLGGAAIGFAVVNSHADSGPFIVTQPNTEVFWTQGSQKTITWSVANTNTAPINCANVKISLSTDSGSTFPIVLAASTPNDGSETVTLPFIFERSCRIKVEAVGNIFFDISDADFVILIPRVFNTNDSGEGSLRQVITDINSYTIPGTGFEIEFKICCDGTLKTINLSSPLPPITRGIYLNGWSQGPTGYTGPPLIELNGAGCGTYGDGSPANGLVFNGAFNGGAIGIAINRFAGSGAVIQGGAMITIQSCYIGTNAAGSAAAGNLQNGVVINNSFLNFLYRNVISGNNVGVLITGTGSTSNALQRNLIGTDATGEARIPNVNDGVRILNASGNLVGVDGADANEGNIISGNGTANGVDAIEINGSTASGNIVRGNLIGLNAAGTAILHNTGSGVHIVNAPGTIIGGPGAETRNIISGAGPGFLFARGIHIEGSSASGTIIRGNYIGTNAAGTADLGNYGGGIYVDNAPNTVIGGLVLDQINEGNIVSGTESSAQIYIIGSNATGTKIKGNYIGLNATGDAVLNTANTPIGIRIESSNNQIGGIGLSDGNVISGNVYGIEFLGVDASANVVQGNRIGTDKSGTIDLGNAVSGIRIFLGKNNLIGGITPGARNLISGNNNEGIIIIGNGTDPQGNLVQGNYIGTNAAGTAAIGSGASGAGIVLSSVKNVTIGGTAPGAGNLISGNGNSLGSDGVLIGGNPATGIVVQGNLIGTNAAGTAALGNTGRGILVSGFAGGVTIGGASPAGRNLIAASAQYGIQLSGTGNNVVKGNLIGTDATGTANLRNSLSGIYIESANNIIGGPGPGEGNIVAFNGVNTNYSGIQAACCSTGNTIRGNSIFSNASLGIDIGGLGFTANDNCDADTGGNNQQNYPLLIGAINGAGNIRVEGTLNSTASSTFTLDFYSNPACDGLNGEGKTHLGSASVMTAANCIASFTGENAIMLGVTVPAGQVVTATATDAAGSTSEFSTCVQVTGVCGAVSPTSQSFTLMGGSGSVNVTAAAGCNWTAASNAAWITIVSEAGGAGNGVVSYEVRENFDAPSRTGTLTIAEQVFTITQSGNCTYSIAPAQRSHPRAGGTGSINVTADPGCNWTALSGAAWITITSGNGTGNGTVDYSVAANPGPKGRTGTITVGGRVFTVKQKG